MGVVGYSNVRANEGCAIGTIMAFAGSPGDVPYGWLICDGRTYNGGDTGYFDLYAVIGTEYGGDPSGPTFKVPRLRGAVADIHTNYANLQPHPNISGAGVMTSSYTQYIDNANGESNDTSTVNLESNMDLTVNIVPDRVNTRLNAIVTEMTMNPPFYSDTIGFVSRMLGDHHFAAHGHGGQTSTIAGDSDSYAVRNLSGTEPEYTDVEVSGYPCESNGNSSMDNDNGNVFARVDGNVRGNTGTGDYWGIKPKFHSGGFPKNYHATGQLLPRTRGQSWDVNNYGYNATQDNFTFQGKTFIEDTINDANGCMEADRSLKGYTKGFTNNGNSIPDSNSGTAAGNIFGYPVTLNRDGTTFVGSGVSHKHQDMIYEIRQGSMRAPNTIFMNNVMIGDVTPINDITQDVATVFFNTMEGPSCNMIYIIRAF